MPYVTSVERIGLQKGRVEGRREGELTLVLRLLARRCGTLSPNLAAQVQALSVEQIESLGEALLDFTNVSDLEGWLSREEG